MSDDKAPDADHTVIRQVKRMFEPSVRFAIEAAVRASELGDERGVRRWLTLCEDILGASQAVEGWAAETAAALQLPAPPLRKRRPTVVPRRRRLW